VVELAEDTAGSLALANATSIATLNGNAA
jgi:hypothetical protein